MATRPTLVTFARTFSSSASTSAAAPPAAGSTPGGESARQKALSVSVRHSQTLKPFEFNDIPWLGYVKLSAMKEIVELGEKVRDHEETLKAQRTKFIPPTSQIRITRQRDLVIPSPHIEKKRTALIPVSALPLSGPDAIHRIKVIAGPRWSPGKPGVYEMEVHTGAYHKGGLSGVGKEGWLKLSEDRFEEPMMNQKSLSDTLDRLIAAANDESSPITTDVPIDMRHLIARRRRQKGSLTHAQAEAKGKRQVVKGAAVGFPKEWISDEVKQVAERARKVAVTA